MNELCFDKLVVAVAFDLVNQGLDKTLLIVGV